MCRSIASLGCLVGVVVIGLSAGCSRTPPRLYPPKVDPAAAGAEALNLADTNKDGTLDEKELSQFPGLKASIKMVDVNADGRVTADEIAARIRQWQDSKLGRMSMSVTVTQNGKPLPGAKVAFVPEKFLGAEVQTATGETDANGVAMLSIPTSGPSDPPGVAPGFYRVEITKEGANIPAEYNTQTTLGQEVAIDAEGLMMGIRFDLK